MAGVAKDGVVWIAARDATHCSSTGMMIPNVFSGGTSSTHAKSSANVTPLNIPGECAYLVWTILLVRLTFLASFAASRVGVMVRRCDWGTGVDMSWELSSHYSRPGRHYPESYFGTSNCRNVAEDRV